MRIAHISSDYPYTALYRRLLLAFADQGLGDHLMYVPLQAGRNFAREQDVEGPTTRIHYSVDFRAWERLLQGRKASHIAAGFRTALGSEQVDLLHAHYLISAGTPAMEIARERGIPYVVAVRNADRNTFLRWFRHLRPLARQCLRDAAAVVFLAPCHRDATLQDLFDPTDAAAIDRKSHVLPNGIARYWHLNRSGRRTRTPGPLRVLFVGDFNENKNLRSTLAAALELRRRGRSCRVTLLGDGPLLPWAQAQQRRFPSLLDVLPREKDEGRLAAIYRHHDVFVMPSFHETFGMVYLEALSQGTPVVWTRGQGIDGYFPDGSVGFGCDPHSVGDIARALERVDDQWQRLSDGGPEAIGPFSWPAIARRYAALYEGVITSGAAAPG